MAKVKKFPIVVAALLFLLMCYVYFTMRLDNWADIIYCIFMISLLIVTVSFALGIYLYLQNNNRIIMHVSVGISAIGALVFSGIIWLYEQVVILSFVCMALCVCILVAFYILGMLFIKDERPQNSPFHLLCVAIFSVVLASTDCLEFMTDGVFGVVDSSMQWNVGWFTLIAIVIGVGYYYLYYLKRIKNGALIASIVCGVLTIVSCCMAYFVDGRYLSGNPFYIGAIYIAFGTTLSAAVIFIIGIILLRSKKICRSGKKEISAMQDFATPTKDPLEALSDLNKLRQAGILTEEEYQEQKNKILGDK